MESALANTGLAGDIVVHLGPGNSISSGDRSGFITLDETSGYPYAAVHMPCGCAARECLGIVHWFRLVEDESGLRLIGMGHPDVAFPVQVTEEKLTITDSSGLDIIDEREEDISWMPEIPQTDQETLHRLRNVPAYRRWEAAHPTEDED